MSWSTTTQRAWRSPGTRSAAAWTNARTGVIPRVPMISLLVMRAPSQWVTSISSRPGQAGEQVLVAPREADDLVGEHRPDDHRHVAVDHEPVDADGDGLLEATARQAAHLLGRERAQRDEGVVVPPLVVDDGETVDADHGLHRHLGHGGMGAEGRDRLQRPHPALDRPHDGAEEERQRAATGGVRDDQAEGAVVEVEAGELGLDEGGDGIVGQDLGGTTDGRGHGSSRSTSMPWRTSCSSVPATSSAKAPVAWRPRAAWLRARRSRPSAAALSAPASGSSTSGSTTPRSGSRVTAASQTATTTAKRSVGRSRNARAATTGNRRWASYRQPSAPTWRQVSPRLRVAEATERLLREGVRLDPRRAVGHLEDVVDQPPHERRHDGMGRGIGDGLASRQQSAVGEGRVGAVEQPELPSLVRHDVADDPHPDVGQGREAVDLGDEPGTVVLGHDGGLVPQPEAPGDGVEVQWRRGGNHAVDDRGGEPDVLHDPAGQADVGLLRGVDHPLPEQDAVP